MRNYIFMYMYTLTLCFAYQPCKLKKKKKKADTMVVDVRKKSVALAFSPYFCVFSGCIALCFL